MSSDIEHLTEKIANLSTEPIYDTNWCDMPDDIKLECIGKMDFCQRWSLRCTAKAERSLVDSKKIKFYEGIFYKTSLFQYDENYSVSLSSKNRDTFSKTFKNTSIAFKFLNYIWKIGVFEGFEISSDHPTVKVELIKDTGKISARNIAIDHCDNEMADDVLQKLKNGVETVRMHCTGDVGYNFDGILAISQLQNLSYWHIENYKRTDSLYKVGQSLIDRNSKIGFIFQVYVNNIDGSVEEFSKHFAERIVSESEKRVRIRTNNPDRHILVERGLDDVVGIEHYLKFYRLIVISAGMKQSEYDDNCKEWICNMSTAPYEYYVY
ncbi:unnamed protein product [Caenorhabditis nigoni]